MLKLISILIAILFILLGLILGLLNPHEVLFDGYFFRGQYPLSLLLAFSFILGMLITAFIFSSQLIACKWRLAKQKKALDRAEAKIVDLNAQQLMKKAESHSQQDENLPESPVLPDKKS
ncbi:LapA family protein [Galenea microaerophila]